MDVKLNTFLRAHRLPPSPPTLSLLKTFSTSSSFFDVFSSTNQKSQYTEQDIFTFVIKRPSKKRSLNVEGGLNNLTRALLPLPPASPPYANSFSPARALAALADIFKKSSLPHLAGVWRPVPPSPPTPSSPSRLFHRLSPKLSPPSLIQTYTFGHYSMFDSSLTCRLSLSQLLALSPMSFESGRLNARPCFSSHLLLPSRSYSNINRPPLRYISFSA